MTEPLCYAFEEAGVDLDLLPLAARRALDAAATKISLEAWRTLPLEGRYAIARAGLAEQIDVARVRAEVAAIASEPCVGRPDPDPTRAPSGIAELLTRGGLRTEAWPALRPLDRWALVMLSARGKDASVAKLIDELRQRDAVSRPRQEG